MANMQRAVHPAPAWLFWHLMSPASSELRRRERNFESCCTFDRALEKPQEAQDSLAANRRQRRKK